MSRSHRRGAPWPESRSRPLVHPIAPAVVYTSADLDEIDAIYEGQTPGFTYAREGHPNASLLAAAIDRLEGAEGGIVVGSGMAAITAVMFGLLQAGDHVIGGDQLYGRSLRMLREDLPRYGVATSLADATDVEAVAAAIRPETKLILVEVVSNPTIRVADIDGILRLARAHGILVAIDNTFTTPRGFQPLAAGADIIIHSVTKLLAGHSDATLGYVAARAPEHREQLAVTAATLGLTASPFDCWLAERGLQSFALRYDRAEANAVHLANHLSGLPGVARVLYPMRSDHPDHNRAVALLGGHGGNMVSFSLHGGRDAANALVRAAPEIAFAPTLGDVATTLSNPATSSHRGLTPAARAAIGIDDGFFRVSVGIEEPGEIAAALADAIASIS